MRTVSKKCPSTGTARITLENVEGAFCPTVDILFARGGITEEAHYFLWETGNLFDKPGCVLYKSSCVCLPSEQGLWDLGSLM